MPPPRPAVSRLRSRAGPDRPARDPLVRARLYRRHPAAAGSTRARSSAPSGYGAARPPLTVVDFDDFILWVTLGIILGGRLGYVLFYNPALFRRAPAGNPAALEGRHVVPRRLPRLRARGDRCSRAGAASRSCRSATSPARSAPIGLFLGRIANFINGELWGRTTDVPWAMVFPGAGPLPRHPSQLYEAALEGLVLFVVLAVLMRAGALKRPGLIIGAFAVGYGLARIDLRILPRARSAARLPVGRADHGHAAVAAADARRHRADHRRRGGAKPLQQA